MRFFEGVSEHRLQHPSQAPAAMEKIFTIRENAWSWCIVPHSARIAFGSYGGATITKMESSEYMMRVEVPCGANGRLCRA